MATYLEVAETIARRMGGIVTVSPNKYRGKTFLIVGSRKKEYFTFPPTLDPTKDVWVPGGYVTCNIPRLHETALRPIFVASGRPGVKWADLVAETDYAQLKEREKGINEALGVDLLQTNVGAKGDYKGDSPPSLFLRPILEVNLFVLLGQPHWSQGWGGWVSSHKGGVWVEDGPDLLERLRALLDGFLDGTYPRESPYNLLQPEWTEKKEAALAIERFIRSAAPRPEPEREYLNYFGFDDTTD